MNKKKSALGKTLGDLLSYSPDDLHQEDARLLSLPLGQVKKGKYQPRISINPEELTELTNSIKSQGVVQPILVRELSANKYEIIAGERRWRAASKAGLKEIPAVVKSIDDEKALAIGLIENMQRKDLNPIEEALGLQRLHNEFALTHQAVADLVGKSRTVVTNLLRLLTLAPQVQQLLSQAKIEVGHAKMLVPLPSEQQIIFAQEIVEKGLSVRQIELRVKSLQNKEPTEKRHQIMHDLEERLSRTIGKKVSIFHRDNGKGRLVINYQSTQDLEELLSVWENYVPALNKA